VAGLVIFGVATMDDLGDIRFHEFDADLLIDVFNESLKQYVITTRGLGFHNWQICEYDGFWWLYFAFCDRLFLHDQIAKFPTTYLAIAAVLAWYKLTPYDPDDFLLYSPYYDSYMLVMQTNPTGSTINFFEIVSEWRKEVDELTYLPF
jgi:hypothetical protein